MLKGTELYYIVNSFVILCALCIYIYICMVCVIIHVLNTPLYTNGIKRIPKKRGSLLQPPCAKKNVHPP